MLGGKSYTILQTYDTNARPQTAGPWEANALKNIKFYMFFWEARWPAVAQTIGFYRCSKPRWPKSTVFQRQISGRLECRITCGNHWALLTPPRPLQLRAVWGFFNIIYGFVVLFIISDTFPPPRGSRNIFCSTQWPPLVPQ